MFHGHFDSKKCTFCRGSGKVGIFLDLFTEMCPACGGQGSVLVTSPAKRCAYCNGQGKVDHLLDLFFTKPCPACDGTGWAHVIVG
jgi:DnaJ-class molecular chaperone